MSKDEFLKISALELYRYKKNYYSRSVVGLKRDLFLLKGLGSDDALTLIEHWISSEQIKATLTKDNHYILN